jgi:hypothetical protein
VHGLCCIMPVMFSFSSTFHCTSCLVWWFTARRDPFSCMCFEKWRHVDQGFVVQAISSDILRQQQWHYHFKTHSQSAYWSILQGNTSCLHILHTVQLPQDKLAHCVLSHIILVLLLLHEHIYVWMCPLHVTNTNSVSVTNCTHMYTTFLTQIFLCS